MTFKSDEIRLLYREYPMFCLWAAPKGILFLPRQIAESEDEFGEYDLTSKLYIFMKRLHQSYSTVMLMDAEERDKIFKMEMKLIEEEQKQAKEAQNKK